MALINNSDRDNFILTLGRIIDNPAQIESQYNTDLIDTFIQIGLNQMAMFADPDFHFLADDTQLTPPESLPADYLYHNRSMPLTANVGLVRHNFYYARNEVDFYENLNGVLTRRLYKVNSNTVIVNDPTVTEVEFRYIKRPTQALTAGSTVSNEFQDFMYTHLTDFVAGKLFLTEKSNVDQRQRAQIHIARFYNNIGAQNVEELVERQVA